MRNLCDIFRKLALGEWKEFSKAIDDLYEGNSAEKSEEEMRNHIKNCHICFGTIQKMTKREKKIIGALLNIDINRFERVRK